MKFTIKHWKRRFSERRKDFSQHIIKKRDKKFGKPCIEYKQKAAHLKSKHPDDLNLSDLVSFISVLYSMPSMPV